MIRVRLLSEPEYEDLRRNSPYREYTESQFYDLLRQRGIFDDEESCSLLRHLHGNAAVIEKWYARTTADGEPCLPAISPEAKYGLVVIENSRKGIYTNLCEEFSEFETEQRMEQIIGGELDIPLVWEAFARIDMEILLTFCQKDFFFSADIPISTGFLLENHRIDGVPTEVWVEGTTVDVPKGKADLPRVENSFYDRMYQWEQETKTLLKTIHREVNGNLPLAKGSFSLADFYKMCGDGMSDYDSRLEQQREELVELGAEYEPPEELWRVINHMEYLPDDVESRRLRYLIIQKSCDGGYLLRSEISVKYPSYGEMFYDVTTFAVPDGEILVLPVDVEEVLRSSEDIKKAVCAFRLADGVVETFGPKEGLREFAAMLQTALESGQCGISEEEPEKV